MKARKLFTTVMISFFFLSACDDDDNHSSVTSVQTPTPAANTIVDTAVANGNFTTLVAALQATGLDATLADTTQEFTVFAPTDDAFALLGQDTIDALLADTDTLSSILTYHVLSGRVDASAAIGAAGSAVATVNEASVGLSLSGDMLLVNAATVTATDIMTDNGIIHVIDAVLLPPAEMTEPTMNIVETALADEQFSTLVSALQAADLVSALADADVNYTVFAPTNAAFNMIDERTLNALIADKDALTSVLLQHVVDAKVDAVTAYTLNGQNATTLSGAMIPVAINTESDMLTFGGANIVMKDIYTTNGVIHVIDTVVVADVELPSPPMSIVDVAIENGNFTTLVAALQATGLDTTLADLDTDFTVFAPTDAAFSLLGQATIDALLSDTDTLSNILLNHVIVGAKVMQDAAVGIANSAENMATMANEEMVALSLSGSNLYINKSKVSAADVMADNGVIHVLDQVIVPPAMTMLENMTIVDAALATPELSTLVTALTAANLVDTLADENASFTVFAPTNSAFEKIDSMVLTDLLGNIDALTGVLTQHVVSGAQISATAAFAANGASVNTVANNDVTVSLVNFADTDNMANDEVAYHATMQMLVGGESSAMSGNTLYVFDNDLGSSTSVCNDTCATNWPPVLVSDGEVDNIPGLSTVMRDDSTYQAAYLGRPLYFYKDDMAPGDENGQGIGGVWWKVSQEQVSLQIQGSNVTTTNIYTSNGVVHLIDTVITETLE